MTAPPVCGAWRAIFNGTPADHVEKKPLTFQGVILTLQNYWAENGCVILQPYDMEMGAGTFHPATTLRSLGPNPWNAAYVQPCRRPTDGRYGANPNRFQHYYQFQVALKPSPPNIQDLYLGSLDAIGVDRSVHDIRFVEDDWESPTLGAWGLGWEITTTVTSAPVLAISKTDAPDPVAAGSNITYTLSYSNTGNANATGTVVTDTIPANTTFVSATGGGTLAAGVVTWNIGPLAAGASGSVQLVVAVASPLNNGTVITNGTYAVDSNETSPVAGAAITTTVTSAPVLAISKTDSPDPVARGGTLTYTVTVTNHGPSDAASVVVTDPLPAFVTLVSTAGCTEDAPSFFNWLMMVPPEVFFHCHTRSMNFSLPRECRLDPSAASCFSTTF